MLYVGSTDLEMNVLANAVTNDQIGDPELLAIKACFKLCQKFLLTHPHLHAAVFQMLSEISDDPKKITGPFGALKRWIHRIRWTVTHSGSVVTDRNLVLSLIATCSQFLMQQLDHAWGHVVRREVKHRKGMENIPEINITVTTKTFATFPDQEQQTLALYACGAFTHENQARHWNDQSGECIFCGSTDDSQIHRVLHCPAFENLREHFSETFQWVRQHCSFWAATPLLPVCPDETTWMQICSLQRNVFQPPDECEEPQKRRRFFTDGSCRNPTQPEASFAAWSVLEDVSNEEDRRDFVKTFVYTGQKPQCFKIIQKGYVYQKQSNDRAELTALICALSQAYWCVIFSDSQYAIMAARKALASCDLSEFVASANFDLMLDLYKVIGNRTMTQISLNHIHSHQDVHAAEDSEHAFKILGNAEADFQADSVWDDSSSETMRPIVQSIQRHYSMYRRHHLQFCHFLVALTKQYSTIKASTKTDSTVAQPEGDDSHLLAWSLSGPTIQFDVGLSDEMAVCFPHPSYFVKAVAFWLQKLVWPQAVPEGDVGVTWFELLVDCVSTTGVLIPKQAGKYAVNYWLYSTPKTKLEEDDLEIQIKTFRSCVKFLAAATGNEVYPKRKYDRCKSLMCFVNSKPSQGVWGRPILASTKVTLDSIRLFHQKGAHTGVHTTRFVPRFSF